MAAAVSGSGSNSPLATGSPPNSPDSSTEEPSLDERIRSFRLYNLPAKSYCVVDCPPDSKHSGTWIALQICRENGKKELCTFSTAVQRATYIAKYFTDYSPHVYAESADDFVNDRNIEFILTQDGDYWLEKNVIIDGVCRDTLFYKENDTLSFFRLSEDTDSSQWCKDHPQTCVKDMKTVLETDFIYPQNLGVYLLATLGFTDHNYHGVGKRLFVGEYSMTRFQTSSTYYPEITFLCERTEKDKVSCFVLKHPIDRSRLVNGDLRHRYQVEAYIAKHLDAIKQPGFDLARLTYTYFFSPEKETAHIVRGEASRVITSLYLQTGAPLEDALTTLNQTHRYLP